MFDGGFFCCFFLNFYSEKVSQKVEFLEGKEAHLFVSEI